MADEGSPKELEVNRPCCEGPGFPEIFSSAPRGLLKKAIAWCGGLGQDHEEAENPLGEAGMGDGYDWGEAQKNGDPP
jgi:hypothetical protein